jgi:hypothetical protein
MKNYFEEFYKRYEDLKGELVKSVGDLSFDENLKKAISDHHQLLNNIIMAGLGMGTLYLRMGAVLMIAEKTNKSAVENDISFLKVMAEKLIHKLPADGDWLEIWKKFLETEKQCKWNEIISKSAQPDIHVAFVSLRNDIAHQTLVISPFCQLSQVQKALKILDGMTSFRIQFQQSIISTENNEVHFQYSSNEEKLKISPFVQINKGETKEEIGILPYLFQGRYNAGAKFINPEGAETKAQKDERVDDTFEKIKSDISRFNGDKAFDFKDKINTYNEWCIGRENEVNAILDWINNSETDKNVLPIFAPAGLGKGALVAKVKETLVEKNIKHLIHFCGSGAENNLQAILYHLIFQGKNYEYLDQNKNKQKKNIWNNLYLPPKLQARFDRLPTQYIDVIELFQALLEITDFESDKKNKLTVEESSRLVIIIDGLDEAAVADHSKRISDWFYTYKDDAPNADDIRSKRAEKWISPKHIKWIFTFRYTKDESKKIKQYDYPNEIKAEFNIEENDSLQPLKPLNITAEELNKELMNDLKEKMNENAPTLTNDFINAILEKGKIKDKLESSVK